MAEQPCLEEAVSRRKTVRGNVFARNAGNHTKQKGSVHKNSPPSAAGCFCSGSQHALFQSHPQIRLMKVTGVPSQNECDPSQGHVWHPGTWTGALSLAAGALAPDRGVWRNWPNLVALSLHGFLQLFDSKLDISITIQTILWCSSNTSHLGSYVDDPPNYPSIFPWRVAQGEKHLLELFLYVSPALILQGWLVVWPENPCGMWFALWRWAGGWRCSKRGAWGKLCYLQELVPWSSSCLILSASVIRKYLAALHTSGFCVHSLKSLQSERLFI